MSQSEWCEEQTVLAKRMYVVFRRTERPKKSMDSSEKNSQIEKLKSFFIYIARLLCEGSMRHDLFIKWVQL